MRKNVESISFVKKQQKPSRGGALRQRTVTGAPMMILSSSLVSPRQATESKGSWKVWDRETRTLRYASKRPNFQKGWPKW